MRGHSARLWDSQKKGRSAFDGEHFGNRKNEEKWAEDVSAKNVDENKRHFSNIFVLFL